MHGGPQRPIVRDQFTQFDIATPQSVPPFEGLPAVTVRKLTLAHCTYYSIALNLAESVLLACCYEARFSWETPHLHPRFVTYNTTALCVIFMSPVYCTS